MSVSARAWGGGQGSHAREAANSENDEDANVHGGRELRNGEGGPAGASPVGGSTPAAPAACANPGTSRTVDLQPVFIRASASDPAPTGTTWAARFPPCNTIWNKLGVTFAAAAPVTVTDAAKKSTGDTAAERTAIRGLWSGSAVGVFFVDNDIPSMGGGATITGGGGQPVISDRGGSTTLLAHELGHTLGLGHPPTGADVNTIMTPTGSNATNNPTRNTMGNYSRITWPAATGSTCLSPDP